MSEDRAQELYSQLQSIDMQINAFHQQLERIDVQLSEISATKQSIEQIKDLDGEELYTPFTQGIFLKAKHVADDGVLIHVGDDVVVKKGFDDARSLLDRQMKDISSFRVQMIERLELLYKEGELLEAQARKLTDV